MKNVFTPLVLSVPYNTNLALITKYQGKGNFLKQNK